MKNFMFILILIGVSSIFASSLDMQMNRAFNDCTINENGQISFNATNYGYLGSEEGFGLEWPINSGIDYLYQAALWIGAKKIRRNELGEALYWEEFPPAHWNDCIPASDPNWTQDLVQVVDTLTTVAFDGDWSTFELLPAYNPLESSALGSLYSNNVQYDVIRKVVGNFAEYDDDGDGLKMKIAAILVLYLQSPIFMTTVLLELKEKEIGVDHLVVIIMVYMNNYILLLLRKSIPGR